MVTNKLNFIVFEWNNVFLDSTFPFSKEMLFSAQSCLKISLFSLSVGGKAI